MSEEKVKADRQRGVVLSFKDHKGYGFIREDSSGNDIFFHWSYLQMDGYKTVKIGAKVSYEVGANHNGAMAVQIRIEE